MIEKEIKTVKTKCDSCKQENISWWTTTELWLRFCQKEDFFCPKCFIEKAKPKLKTNEGIGFMAEIFYK